MFPTMPDDTFTIAPQVMARQVGSETVILDLASGLYFGLDEVGTRVWELIGAGRSVDTICETLQDEYDVAGETLRKDVLALVDDLRSRGLLAAN
jgi:hypothetical protein